jgi:hypothetical protein
LRGVNTYRFFDHSKPHAGKSSMNAEVAEGAERKRRREKKKKRREEHQSREMVRIFSAPLVCT